MTDVALAWVVLTNFLAVIKKKIILKRVFHRDKWCILISFKYDGELAALVKQIYGHSYSSTYNSWCADAMVGFDR